jgi:hypothetical protein
MMLRKFLALPPADRRLLIRAGLWVSAVKLMVWLLPFRHLTRLLGHSVLDYPRVWTDDDSRSDRIIWAVQAAARLVPGATCLTQAMATRVLLNRGGFPAELRIGVTKGAQGQLKAHAWLEAEGVIVMGEHLGDTYIPFDSLPGWNAPGDAEKSS